MKKIFILFLFASIVLNVQSQSISMQSLLRDMVNRERLAEYPTSQFKSLQASSYNRQSVSPDKPGWFADSDGVFCIRTEENNGKTEWVLMEDDGPGAITKIWAVCFYYGLDNLEGANIKIYLDGAKEPTVFTNFFKLVKGQGFVKPPLAEESARAGNIYLPIPYAKGCKVTMDKKVFYNIINYQSYPKGTPVKTFTMADFESSKVLVDSVGRALRRGVFTVMNNEKTIKKTLQVKPHQSKQIKLPKGNKAIKQLKLKLNSAQALRSTILKASFDGDETIWIPVGDFFNNGVGVYPYNMWEREVQSDGTMICKWVMPYEKSATISFENLAGTPCEITAEISTENYEWTSNSMHFHASWRMDNPTPTFPLFDYNLLEVEGKGVYVGDQFTVLNPSEGWWGEGDEKVYVDDDFKTGFPSQFGTGTEDYYGWAGGVYPTPKDEFSRPFLSNVRVGSPNAKGYNTCTRTRVLDAIPFQERLKFDIESSAGTRTSWFHLVYTVSTYWYALPGAETNRKPLPEMAAKTIPSLEGLTALNDKAKANIFVVDGAIEAENLSTYQWSKGVVPNDKLKVWGELSNNKLKGFTFTEVGQKMTVRLTEIFSAVDAKACFIIGNQSGVFEIIINGKKNTEMDFLSEHSGVYVLDLGKHNPINNTIEITFISKSKKNSVLGIDYFLIK